MRHPFKGFRPFPGPPSLEDGPFQGNPPPPITGSMGFTLINAAFRAMAHVHRALQGLDLEPPHHAVLMALDVGGPQSQKAIAETLVIDRTTMVHLLDALEGRGLVRRDRDPKDRRAHAVYLTEEGATLLKEANERLQKADAEYLLPLSPMEQRQLRSFLVRLTADPPPVPAGKLDPPFQPPADAEE